MEEVPLTRGLVAIVDDDDFELINQWKWFANAEGYATRNISIDGKRHAVRMHRLIMSAVDGSIVDHINGNVLDNRRSNLRFVDSYQSARNKGSYSNNMSGTKGVHWDARKKKWIAQIGICGARTHLGTFLEKESAVAAYSEAAKKYHGEFARIND